MDKIECSICLEVVKDESKVYRTKCNHLYCVTCINQWTLSNNTCPVCRRLLYQSNSEVDWERVKKMIVPYIHYLLENPHLSVPPETVYSKFYCFFTFYLKTMLSYSNDAVFRFYFENYQTYRSTLYFVDVDFLENTECQPSDIWNFFLNTMEFQRQPYSLYLCFNECFLFYCLKKGYTENQMILLDQYKNVLHSQLLT